MATKDWKKTHSSTKATEWKKNSSYIFIDKTNNESLWHFNGTYKGNIISINDKLFKTKSQAMNYAKSYMRSH